MGLETIKCFDFCLQPLNSAHEMDSQRRVMFVQPYTAIFQTSFLSGVSRASAGPRLSYVGSKILISGVLYSVSLNRMFVAQRRV
jgi:hypothetical protein